MDNVNTPEHFGVNHLEGMVYDKKVDLQRNYVNGVGEISGHIGANHVHIVFNSFINRFSFKISIDHGPAFIADKDEILMIVKSHLDTPDDVIA